MSLVNKKKLMIISIIVASIVFLVIVGVVVGNLFLKYHKSQLENHVEDKNGSNKELATITDEKIESYVYSYQIYKHHRMTKKGTLSGVKNDDVEEYDRDYVEVSTGLLTGVYIANAYLGNGDVLTYRIESNVKSGNFKIVFTDDTNKILEEIPFDCDITFTYQTQKDKIYYLKLVGESAEIEFKLYRNGYEFD